MKIKITYVLLAVMAFVFLFELTFPQLVEELAFSSETIGAAPWTIITAVFVHADLSHLAANLIAIWFFGLAVEKSRGKKPVVLIFFLGAIVGEAVSLLTYPADTLSLGASGGAFALLGMAMLVHPFMELSSWSGVATLPIVLLAALYIAYNFIGVFSGPSDIAYSAHFTGLAVGLAFGYAARRKMRT